MSFAEVEAMAKRVASEFGGNLGFGNSLHLVPSHRSMICPSSDVNPTAQAEVGETSTTPFRKAVLLPLMSGAGNAVHFVPSKWMVDCPTAQISFGEDADAAKRPLLGFSFGVGTTLKIDLGL
jgi:hypothetical protein